MTETPITIYVMLCFDCRQVSCSWWKHLFQC